MNEPLRTEPNPAGTGRPKYTNEQYQRWLDDMAVFLKGGCSLRYAMDKADLMTHEFSIRAKYRLGDWFSRKVDGYRSYVGEMINRIGVKTVENVNNRMIESDGKIGITTTEEMQVWKTMAKTHRSAQPFFVNRSEVAEVDDSNLGKIIEEMDSSDYDDVAKQAQKQILEANPPVQNQEQGGATSDVQTEHNAAQPHGEEGQSPVQSNPQA